MSVPLVRAVLPGDGRSERDRSPGFLRSRWSDWGSVLIFALLLFAVAPALLSDFRLSLLAKYLCYAMVAIGIGLAWGRGGMLTLGQGVYFGLGAYMMAMHMKLDDAGPGGIPDFMQLISSSGVPSWWEPLRSGAFTVAAIVVVPALVAFGLGFATFRRKVRGAYFAILSQALAAAFAILLVGNPKSTGGSTGLNNFQSFFGYDLADPVNQKMLYFLAAGAVLIMLLTTKALMRSRYGELLSAGRDAEERVRFLGYDPANVKTLAYVIAAVMAAVGGAIFVPIVGIISPNDVGIVPSIGFLIGVAIGGRTTLWGPVLGAVGVAWAQTNLSAAFPSGWTYLQGALFMLVIAFLPGGLASLRTVLGGAVRRGTPTAPRSKSGSVAVPAAGSTADEAPDASAASAGQETTVAR